MTKKTPSITLENVQFNHSFDLEDWDITALFKDTIWAEFIDESDGEKITRGGIVVPETARNQKDFYRIARVLERGPDCSESIQVGYYLLVPPLMGMIGLKKGPNGGSSVFLREEKIMAVIAPKTEEAVRIKEEQF